MRSLFAIFCCLSLAGCGVRAVGSEGSKSLNPVPVRYDEPDEQYSWQDALTACPSGWHLPDDDEYADLLSSNAGARWWQNYAESGVNGYEFVGEDGNLFFTASGHDRGEYGVYWSATSSEFGGEGANASVFYFDADGTRMLINQKSHKYSVRCVKKAQ